LSKRIVENRLARVPLRGLVSRVRTRLRCHAQTCNYRYALADG